MPRTIDEWHASVSTTSYSYHTTNTPTYTQYMTAAVLRTRTESCCTGAQIWYTSYFLYIRRQVHNISILACGREGQQVIKITIDCYVYCCTSNTWCNVTMPATSHSTVDQSCYSSRDNNDCMNQRFVFLGAPHYSTNCCSLSSARPLFVGYLLRRCSCLGWIYIYNIRKYGDPAVFMHWWQPPYCMNRLLWNTSLIAVVVQPLTCEASGVVTTLIVLSFPYLPAPGITLLPGLLPLSRSRREQQVIIAVQSLVHSSRALGTTEFTFGSNFCTSN